jgi:uncharacterized repeat protein (TIGR01451 family)
MSLNSPLARRTLIAGCTSALLLAQGCSEKPPTPTAIDSPQFAAGTSLNVNLDQCANLSTPNCSWQNGDLNKNNSAFAEGDVVPFRLALEGLAPGTHTIHINYDFTAGGHKAYDFLASVDATESVDLCAAGGGGVSSLCGTPANQSNLGTADAENFPIETFANPAGFTVAGAIGFAALAADSRQLEMYGGTINSVTVPTHAGNVNGNSAADMTVTFTTSGSAVLLVWGGHLAQSAYWKNTDGTPDGAGEVSGAPWHMRTQQLDNSGNKNQDRSIQPSAIIVAPPNLSVAKTPDGQNVTAGSPITFSIVVTNNGTGPATGVTLIDELPAGTGIDWSLSANPGGCSINGSAPTQTLLCSFGDLAAAATRTVTVTSATSAASCGVYNNTATVSATNQADVTDNGSITVQCPGLSIDKVVTDVDGVGATGTANGAGDVITYRITATNSGDVTLTGVTVSDPLLGTLSCTPTQPAQLAPGASIVCTGSYTVTQADLDNNGGGDGDIDNTATADSDQTESVNDSAAVPLAQLPDLGIDKVVTDVAGGGPNGTVDAAGDVISYQITATNTGNVTLTGVSVTDALLGTLSCTPTQPATLAPGASMVCTGSYTVTQADLNSNGGGDGDIDNTAIADSDQTPPTDDSEDVPLSPTPGLAIDKVVTDVDGAGAAGTANQAGDVIAYRITATNTGNVTLTNVTVTDPLLGTLTCTPSQPATLAPDAAIECTGSYTVTQADLNTNGGGDGDIDNTATADSEETDPVSDSAAVPLQVGAGLAIDKVVTDVDGAGAAGIADEAGDVIAYQITATNTGNVTLTNVTVVDALLGTLSCTPTQPATLAPGASMVCTGSYTVTQADLDGNGGGDGDIDNTATADSDQTAPTSDSAAVPLSGQPSLTIEKATNGEDADAAPGPSIPVGQAVNWTYVVTNTGNVTLTNVTVTDDKLASSAITCAPSSNNVIASLAVGASATCTASGTAVAGQYANVGTATSGTVSDTDPSHYFGAAPNLTISKTPDQTGDTGYSVQPGGTATFTITVGNTGPGPAFNTVLNDTLPAGLTWSESKAECSISSITVSSVSRQLLTCSIGTLNVNSTFTVQVSATVPSDFVQAPPSPAGTPIEIDGNLSDEAAAGKDWATVGLNCLSNPAVGCDLDLPTGSTDNSFGQGTKEDSPVPTVVAGSIPNNKSDLLRFYVANERFVATDYLYLAWERVQAPNGTTNMDFELNQSTLLSANGVTPVRTAGDILIKFDLARGGSTPTLGFHRWVTAASAGGQTPSQACQAASAFPCWGKVTALSGDVAAAINTASVTDPINPGAPRTLDALTFGEARINLQATGIFQPGACVNFGRAYLKSRSSDSFTSEIKDFIAPIPVSVSSCQDRFIDNRAWADADHNDPVSDTGQIKVSQSGGSASVFTAPTSVRLAQAPGSFGLVGASEPLALAPVQAARSNALLETLAVELRAARSAATRQREAWLLSASIQTRVRAVPDYVKPVPRIRRMA